MRPQEKQVARLPPGDQGLQSDVTRLSFLNLVCVFNFSDPQLWQEITFMSSFLEILLLKYPLRLWANQPYPLEDTARVRSEGDESPWVMQLL